MRVDTPYGPVWLYPDTLPMKVAMQGARLELAWPDLNGFSAMHTGSGDEGAWVVRAPLAALERAGYRSDSAAEYPVKEGTVWPPTHIKFTFAPPITPEQLYNQDKRKQDWDKQESKLDKEIERSRQWYGLRAERR
jgi:hypothetical protein